jgi:hypothetical protein
MKRRSLETRFWKDSYIQSLTSNGKLLFNYLLTNEYVNIIHIYELPESYIALETGITIKQIQDLKDKFHKDGKFLFKDSWIKIVNADKYEHYEGLLNEKAKENLLKIIPSHIIGYFNTPIDTCIDTQQKVSNNQYPITNNQQPVTKYSKIEDLKEEDFEDIAEKYQVPVSFVKSKYDDLINWHEKNPQKNYYKNYLSALRDWVKRDGIKIKQEYAKDTSDIAL